MKFPEWPIMLKSTHRAVQVENHVLRDALREANNELRKHRRLVAAAVDGSSDHLNKLMGKTKQ